MRRGFRRGFRRAKRRTAWVPGVNFGETVGFATLSLADLGAGSTTFGFTAPLTDIDDQRNLGGEDAVVARVISDVWFYLASNGATPVQRFLRWAFFVAEETPVAPGPGGVAVNAPDLWTAVVLGYENILQTGQVFVGPTDALAPTGLEDAAFQWNESSRLLNDFKVKRKLQENRQLYFTIQAAPVGGTACDSVRCSGYIKVLLMSARR